MIYLLDQKHSLIIKSSSTGVVSIRWLHTRMLCMFLVEMMGMKLNFTTAFNLPTTFQGVLTRSIGSLVVNSNTSHECVRH